MGILTKNYFTDAYRQVGNKRVAMVSHLESYKTVKDFSTQSTITSHYKNNFYSMVATTISTVLVECLRNEIIKKKGVQKGWQ